jgi:hypothetical protein
VARVVDSRSEFIDPESAVGELKKFNGEKTDEVELLGDLGGEFLCGVGDGGGNAGGK